MVKKVMAALLATVAFIPAAQAQDNDGHEGRPNRGEMRQHQARAEGEAPRPAPRAEQPREAPHQPFQRQPDQAQPVVRAEAQGQGGWQGRGGWQDRGDRGPRGTDQGPARRFTSPPQQAEPAQAVSPPQRDWRRPDRPQAFNGAPAQVDGRRADDQRRAQDATRRFDDQRRWDGNGRGNDAYRNGNDNRRFDAPASGNRGNDWNRRWRTDNRFDWGRYRQQNRNLFRLPRYFAPYDWQYGYRRFSIGVTLSSVLWGQDYWIDDPSYYRLPPAYGPYRWVRYYNDALLVDIRTGYVADTVYDIFW